MKVPPVPCSTCCRVMPAQEGRGRPARYCSDGCREWRRQEARRLKRWVATWALRCEACGARLYERGVPPAHGIRLRWCDDRCRGFAIGRYRLGAHASRLRWTPCSDCGAMMQRPPRWQARCRSCRLRVARARDQTKNSRRRGSGNGVDIVGLGNRDGWRCHLCGKSVRRDLPGSHRLGPTVDHLVPVSEGGTDAPENVALAHRICNSRRGATGDVQLRLVG